MPHTPLPPTWRRVLFTLALLTWAAGAMMPPGYWGAVLMLAGALIFVIAVNRE